MENRTCGAAAASTTEERPGGAARAAGSSEPSFTDRLNTSKTIQEFSDFVAFILTRMTELYLPETSVCLYGVLLSP